MPALKLASEIVYMSCRLNDFRWATTVWK